MVLKVWLNFTWVDFSKNISALLIENGGVIFIANYFIY
jgi:hypothetical protein